MTDDDTLRTRVSAFSNGFEWDRWSENWCERCTKMDDCPLLLPVFVEN